MKNELDREYIYHMIKIMCTKKLSIFSIENNGRK